jgi:hypothetical protein
MLAKQYRIVALFRHFCPRALNHKLLFYQTETSKLEEHQADRMDSIATSGPVRGGGNGVSGTLTEKNGKDLLLVRRGRESLQG